MVEVTCLRRMGAPTVEKIKEKRHILTSKTDIDIAQ
jgi:hypothetical protein